jgi:hypothetical protein
MENHSQDNHDSADDEDSAESEHMCEICERSFSKRFDLENHVCLGHSESSKSIENVKVARRTQRLEGNLFSVETVIENFDPDELVVVEDDSTRTSFAGSKIEQRSTVTAENDIIPNYATCKKNTLGFKKRAPSKLNEKRIRKADPAASSICDLSSEEFDKSLPRQTESNILSADDEKEESRADLKDEEGSNIPTIDLSTADEKQEESRTDPKDEERSKVTEIDGSYFEEDEGEDY